MDFPNGGLGRGGDTKEAVSGRSAGFPGRPGDDSGKGVVLMSVHRLTRFIGLPVVLMVAAGTAVAGAGAASASTCVSWTGVAPISPPGGDFTAVAMQSRCDVWAVGTYPNGVFKTLVEHWNGTGWQFEISGNPGGFNQDSVLTGVAAVLGASPWAAGYYSNGTGYQTLIETPKGGVWTQVPTQDPAGPGHLNFLYAVAATSASNAWAVGLYGTGFNPDLTLIERWNGTTWTQVPSPDPSAGSNALRGVTATSASNAWAVGYDRDGQGAFQTLILRWNGIAWTRAPSPNPAGPANDNTLRAVAAASASSAWAVGTQTIGGIPQPLIEHWNGTAWRTVQASTPDPSMPAALAGVTVISARNAWAVGQYGSGPFHTLVVHWNGKAWHQVPSPSPGVGAALRSVASSGTSIWAVGGYSTGGPDLALAVHCC
jgi:hypothetical protein